jgi:hypothetical protein
MNWAINGYHWDMPWTPDPKTFGPRGSLKADHMLKNGTNASVFIYKGDAGKEVILSQEHAIQHTIHDPNDILGPAGYGAQNYIPNSDGPLAYTVEFTNDPTATASVQEVTITETLDPNLDWSTFQVTGFGFGAFYYSIPAGLQTYHVQENVISADGVIVDFSDTFDPATGTIVWTLVALDPSTLQPTTNNAVGFLPPDISPPEGDGYVSYSVTANTGLSTGSQIHSQASIVFEENAAIATPALVDTLDVGAPTSSVNVLAATQTTTHFSVSWTGSDDANGSGIGKYEILVSVDGGAFLDWLTNTTATSGTYTGSPGHTYAFYSVAVDNVGNVQPAAGTAQATTSVPPIARRRTVTQGHPAKFTDAAGKVVTVSLTGPGSGELDFLTAGGSADPISFVLTGTTARSRVTVIDSSGLTLSDVSVAGSLAAFTASSANFIGDFSVTGTLGALSLENLNIGPSTIEVDGGGIAPTFTFGVVNDLSLTTAGAIKTISATSWTDGSAATDSLTAASVGSIRIRGAFDASVTLTTTALAITSFTAGSITGGTWTISGSARTITTASVSSSWTGTFAGGITSLTVRGDIAGSLTAASVLRLQAGSITDATVTLTGALSTLSVRAGLSGTLSAASIGTLTAGNISAEAITLSSGGLAAKSITVNGNLNASTIAAVGSIGKVTVGGASASTIFAGVSSSVSAALPTAAEFTAASSITSFVDRGKTTFSDTFIAASAIGSASLSNVTTSNGGIPFGIATKSLKTFSLSQPRKKPFHWNSRQATSVLTTGLTGDLEVEILTG